MTLELPWPGADRRYRYSPIVGRRGGRWPNGARLAVYLALGVEDYRPGEGHTENLVAGVPHPDLANTAWRDYGNRIGVFRVLDRLAEYDIPPTVLLNTMVYDTAPAVPVAARRHGAEIVGHGVSNSDSLAGRTEPDERAYLEVVARRIAEEEGAAPGGWSSPWLAHTESTVDLPVWLATTSRPLLAIPYPLELNDSSSMIARGVGAAEFADMIVDEFDELLAAAEDQPLVMGVVVHSFISGVPFRLRRLGRALAHLRSRDEGVWFARPGEIHQAFAALHPPPAPGAGAGADRRSVPRRSTEFTGGSG